MTGMCPNCGAEVEIRDGLTTFHDYPKPLRQVCLGSKQNARCAESDARPLWNGEPNLRFAGGAATKTRHRSDGPGTDAGTAGL